MAVIRAQARVVFRMYLGGGWLACGFAGRDCLSSGERTRGVLCRWSCSKPSRAMGGDVSSRTGLARVLVVSPVLVLHLRLFLSKTPTTFLNLIAIASFWV